MNLGSSVASSGRCSVKCELQERSSRHFKDAGNITIKQKARTFKSLTHNSE